MAAWPDPLVGRDEELAFIAETLARADASRGVVIAGSAGVGKTRLAREYAARHRTLGGTVRWASGTQTGAGIPLGAFAGLVGDVAGNPAQLLRRATMNLLGDEAEGDVLVCVDDAHQLDDLSSVLLLQLVLQDRAAVLATVRSGEPSPDAVSGLWSQSLVPRLDLQPLSDAEVGRLAEALLGEEVAPDVVDRLVAISRGNVLMLRLVIDGERAAGRLRRDGGRWRWDGRFRPSPALIDLVGQRVERFGAPVVEVLDALAVAGPLPVRVLAGVCSPEQVEAAEAAGLVAVPDSAADATAAHPLYAEVRRARIGAFTARRLRARVVAAWHPDGTSRAVLRRAMLAMESDLPPDPELLTAAAMTAIQLLDWSLAERLAGAALSAGGSSEARLALAYSLSFNLRTEEAQSVLEELCAADLPPEDHVLVVMSRAAHLFWYRRATELAMGLVEEELGRCPDPELGRWLSAMLGLFEVCTGRVADGMARAERARSEGLSGPMARLCAAWAETAARGATGRLSDHRDAATAAYVAAGEAFNLGQPRIGFANYFLLGLVLSGYVAEAEALVRRVDDDVDEGLPVPRLTVAVLRSIAALAAGRVRESRRYAAEAIAGLEGHDDSGWVLQATIPYVTASALLGERDTAAAAVPRLMRVRHPAHALLEPEELLAQAWVAACSGATSVGVAHARRAAELARTRGQPARELTALHVALRLGDVEAAPRVEELAPSLAGPRAPAVLLHARGLAADDGKALLEASARLEELGDRVAAADAAAQAATAFARGGR
ncbi:AAA family ATPase, partial [Nostocoides japonicum]|uniref:AAA family ATPase n=1 Tax=Nostocoides japonicum TaxID=99481 RepID=UPI00065BDD46